MDVTGRRRLAVTSSDGRLLGLLCASKPAGPGSALTRMFALVRRSGARHSWYRHRRPERNQRAGRRNDYSVTLRLMSDVPSLYEWAGGRAAIETDDQPFLRPGRTRRSAQRRSSPAGSAPLTASTSPPGGARSSGARPDTPSGSAATRPCSPTTVDLGITADQRFRFASPMSLAADDVDLPSDPEFRAALVGYLEWGTRPGHAQLPARRGCCAAGTGAALGLGRCAALPTLKPAARNTARRSVHGGSGQLRPDHR